MKKILLAILVVVLLVVGLFFVFKYRKSTFSNEIPPPKDLSYFYILNGDEELTEKRMEFLATHFKYLMVKGSAINTNKIDKLHQYASKNNPELKILKYTNGIFSLSYKPSDGSLAYAFNQNSRERNNKILEHGYDQGWFLMDLCSQEWKNYFTDEAKKDIEESHFDGIFVDDMGIASSLHSADRIDYIPQDRITKTDYSDDKWYECGKEFLDYSKQRLNKIIIFNGLYHQPPRFSREYLSVSDGGMREGWITSNYSNFLGKDKWKELLDASIKDLEVYNSSFVPFCLINNPKATVDDAMYCFTSYLLVNDPGRVFYSGPKGQERLTNIFYRPELAIDIGIPLQNEADLEGYKDRENNNLYSRKYSNGFVLVNPTEDPILYRFNKEYYLVHLSGTGLVDKNGKVDAKLDYEKVSNVTINKQTGVVLLDRMPN